MTQTVTVVSSTAVTPTIPAGSVTRTTDDDIAVGVWSTAITVEDGSTFTATPGVGGTILVQLSDDAGVTWRDVSTAPFRSSLTSGISAGANRIRATAAVAAGTLIVDTPVATEFATNNGGGVNTSYTAAQLAAMALAGTLTPYTTYVASDESPYQQWALDASTLGSPLGGEYVTVSVAGASGGVVEI